MAIQRYHKTSDRWILVFKNAAGRDVILRAANMYEGPRPILLMSREEAESANKVLQVCRRPKPNTPRSFKVGFISRGDLIRAATELGDKFDAICEALWEEALQKEDERARLLVIQMRFRNLKLEDLIPHPTYSEPEIPEPGNLLPPRT